MYLGHDRTQLNNGIIDNNIYLVVAVLVKFAARGRHAGVLLRVSLDKTNYCVPNCLLFSYFAQSLLHCSDIYAYLIDK